MERKVVKYVGVVCRVLECIRNDGLGKCVLEVIELDSDGYCEMLEIEGEEG